MNRTVRFLLVILVVGILVVVAGGVWASPRFHATVPPVPVTGAGSCPDIVDMSTALFTPQGSKCTFTVNLIAPEDLPLPPDGLAYAGDIFEVTMDPPDVLVSICYAFPPELAEKDAKIYRLNEEADPEVWVELSGAEVKDGVICVTSAAGVFALMGNK